MTFVSLARHGQTEYNAVRRFQGHLAVPLDDVGREQARELARAAAERQWSALLCSPLRRARETAEIVGAAIGHYPVSDARFAETDCGDWTDRTFDEVQAAEPELFQAYVEADPFFAFPGGESFAQQQLRVLEGIDAARTGPLPVLIVCHRGSIRLALAAIHGDDAYRSADIPNASLIDLP
ncbi:MAG TPA: histidine phosphatase family protein [Baekduia sp.]|uniref:histidine phosphatase family protein n=1 Tax=Baekduia sp. TaxID=2600305 RepID=UPI002D769CB9|nr:histidine phosphatase family protein [Baekduia sp.]HET6508915.1 histidine phosphatase family protein [Baekduia sp.]